MIHSMTENKEDLEKMEEALEVLKSTWVEVGLPKDASARNRFLLALHQRGSPIMRIPPRPVVGPALGSAEAQSAMTEALISSCEAAAEGDVSGVTEGFEEAGQAGVDAIHSYIDAGISPANSPVTVGGGWIYNRVARTGVLVGGKGFNKPMYATGELYGAFDWEVKS